MKYKSYFRSSGHLENSTIETDSGYILDIATLPPFLRTLLVMDGTVTKALEAWFWEPVRVVAKRNFREKTPDRISDLKLVKGDDILQREVCLQGKQSDKVFATAKSVVSLKQLPAEIGEALEKGLIGIGGILRDKGLETYRDIYAFNYYPESLQLEHCQQLNGEVIARSYRIWINGNPAINVSEFFPISLYRDTV